MDALFLFWRAPRFGHYERNAMKRGNLLIATGKTRLNCFATDLTD